MLVRCHHITVRPLLSASTCSEQLALQDEEGRPWRLHAGNSLLTDIGVKVPYDSPSPVYTFLTKEGKYVEQSPNLKEVAFNLTSLDRTNSFPSFLAIEEDKHLFPSTNSFQDPGGLYSEEEMVGTEDAFLREWSILTGTPPEALLAPQEPSPPASAASSAHARTFPSTSEAAMQGVETFLRSSIRTCLGRVLSSMEQFVLTIILMARNPCAVCMLINKLFSIFAHLLGCVGAGSTQSWQDACLWACCGTMKLAATARKGFHASPPPPTPSAPPLMDPGLLDPQAGGVGGDAPVEPASKPFLNKWKARRARKKSQAPPTPGSTEESRTGHLRPLPRAAVPLLPHSEPRRRPAPGPFSLPPVKAPSQPAVSRRSASTPRKSSRQEEVKILLPSSDLATDLAKVFFKRTPT